VVAFPIFLWSGHAAVAGLIIYVTATQKQDGLMNGKTLTELSTTFLSITLLTNLISTGKYFYFPCYVALSVFPRSYRLAYLEGTYE
jgi:hypothetical protein